MKKSVYKEVFVFIAGSTPQVITETIYALTMKVPPVYPDSLFIITTSRGRQIIEDALFKKGVMRQLAEEYGLPGDFLKDISFIVPSDRRGEPLDDIRNESDNETMADLIASFIRDRAEDSSVRLHCSIAGGRKTMSFYLGASMQLFGRPWDKLYHVLVSPEFESHPEFFYPPRENRTIMAGSKNVHTRDALLTLAELPFIRLRDKVSPGLKGFRVLVAESQKEIDVALVHPELKVRFSERALFIGRSKIRLTPLHLVVYVAYLKHKLYRCRYSERPYCLDCADCFPEMVEFTTKAALEEMAKDYMKICPSKAGDFLHKYKKTGGLGMDAVRQAVSKIRRVIAEQLADETLASYYTISTSHRVYAGSRHGVKVDKGKIRIEE